jgi:hypothetical protein
VHAAISNGPSKPLLRSQPSPPLGFPLAAAVRRELQKLYSEYTKEIVQYDLWSYVPVAYTDQESLVPQRLLGAVCSFYTALFEAEKEVCPIRNPVITPSLMYI